LNTTERLIQDLEQKATEVGSYERSFIQRRVEKIRKQNPMSSRWLDIDSYDEETNQRNLKHRVLRSLDELDI